MNEVNKNPPSNGGNAFYKAIDSVIKILDEEDSAHVPLKKIVMFFSDGGDCEPNKTLLPNSIANLINKHGCRIEFWWNMGFGLGADVGVLD